MGKKVNVLLSAVACVFSLATAVQAQQVEISSSLNPVGSGARATGMGGAFIAIADDATAASWNPGGLVQLEKPEFSLVYSYFNRQHSYQVPSHPEMDKDQSVDLHELNYASFAYPFHALNKNMIFSLNYQRMFELDKAIATPFNQKIGTIGNYDANVQFKQEGYLSTLTPAFAIQVIPELYLGAAVNIWSDFMGTSNWKFNYSATGTQTLLGVVSPLTIHQNDKYSFDGINYTFGTLLNFGKTSVGAVLKTPFTADVDRESEFEQIAPNVIQGKTTTKDTIKMSMPMSYGIGVSHRFSDALTFAVDVYRTDWSGYKISANGQDTNPVTGLPLSQGRLKDTTQVKLGGEYLYMKNKLVIPVRAGVFYDPEPGYRAENDSAGNLVTKMTRDDFFGFSLGSGVTYENWSFDASYGFRKGSNVSSELVEADSTTSVTQHTVLASLIYRF